MLMMNEMNNTTTISTTTATSQTENNPNTMLENPDDTSNRIMDENNSSISLGSEMLVNESMTQTQTESQTESETQTQTETQTETQIQTQLNVTDRLDTNFNNSNNSMNETTTMENNVSDIVNNNNNNTNTNNDEISIRQQLSTEIKMERYQYPLYITPSIFNDLTNWPPLTPPRLSIYTNNIYNYFGDWETNNDSETNTGYTMNNEMLPIFNMNIANIPAFEINVSKIVT